MNLFSPLSKFVFCSLNSGSNGNSYFIGAEDYGILVDAGISASMICSRLNIVGRDIQCVKALFLTHSHIDHVRGVAQLMKRYNIPVYASEDCVSVMNDSCKTTNMTLFNVVTPIINIEGLKIESFYTEHDSPGSLGFLVSYGD